MTNFLEYSERAQLRSWLMANHELHTISASEKSPLIPGSFCVIIHENKKKRLKTCIYEKKIVILHAKFMRQAYGTIK